MYIVNEISLDRLTEKQFAQAIRNGGLLVPAGHKWLNRVNLYRVDTKMDVFFYHVQMFNKPATIHMMVYFDETRMAFIAEEVK